MQKAAALGQERGDVTTAVDDLPGWLGSSTPVASLAAMGRATGRGWSFAWMSMSANATRGDLERSIAAAGAEVLGGSGRLLRVRLPADEARIRRIAGLAGVDRLTAMPPQAKLKGFGTWPTEPGSSTQVFVTLMADDNDGRWGRELFALGAVVERYDPQIRVYTASATADVLPALARADFVLAVEPVGRVAAANDGSIPAMGADALRMWTGAGLFGGVGGESVPVGVMDSGFNRRHNDLAENRASICGANFVTFEARDQASDLWVDAGGHGTHVTGTFIGNGFGSGTHAGVAPSVRDVRVAKVLHSQNFGTIDDISRGMDWLASATACDGSDEIRPLVVNVSLAVTGPYFEGRDVGTRKLDAIVWDRGQLFVVAQANSGSSGFSDYGAAKNSLSVGATYVGGDIAAFSSHGPTADGRLAPHVVAPGVEICSARGNGAVVGYTCEHGTSFASPAVAGTAALLMDAVPEFRRQPALARARLMASAIRPDAWFDAADAFALDNSGGPRRLQARYGLGKASARTAILERDAPDGWTGGGVTVEVADAETYAYQDVRVPVGAKRLDVVLTWDEPAVEPVAQPVLNDLDLWLDGGADCANGPCGERSSTSRIDNVEWVMVRDPAPGVWRLKVVGNRVHTAARAAVAWNVIRGESTPALAVAVGPPARLRAENHPRYGFDLSVTAASYVAAGAALHFECRGEARDCERLRVLAADVAREDGLTTSADVVSLPDGEAHVPLGRRIALGEIAAGETATVEVEVAYSGAGPVDLHYTASAWNASGASGSVVVRPRSALARTRSSRPTNDDLRQATGIEGPAGSVEVDLAGATPEPGEPPASALERIPDGLWVQRPLGSLWYRWRAPADALVTFRLSGGVVPGPETLAVFDGDAPAALDLVASNQWIEREPIYESGRRTGVVETLRTAGSVAFFARLGTSYLVRVANSERSAGSLTLRWHQGDGPANDDFDAPLELAGAKGETQATNVGATLEKGESFGELAATAWHIWTAPDDGRWTFHVDVANLRVAAFTGEGVDGLRLVSGIPRSKVGFKARAGQIYRIAVATKDAYAAGAPYKLSWVAADRGPVEDDDFESRTPLAGESGAAEWKIGESPTVQPGEPPPTGVRTVWRTWTAPVGGDYTWRLGTTVAGPTVAVFAGDGLQNLQLAGTTGRRADAPELVFTAEAETEYALALGWRAGDYAAYVVDSASGQLSWGPTPGNDRRTRAIALDGTRGTTSADDRYATTALGERDDLLGHSSLWWTWQAPAAGWYTFRAAGRHVTVYETASDVPVAQGRLVDGETTFRAEAGATYTIRVGSPVAPDGADYRLDWAPTNAPAWLRYAGALSDGVDGSGAPVALANPASLAASGDTVFAVSDHGLEVFRPDADGALIASQNIDLDLSGSLLAWDPARARLLANRCGDWWAFVRTGTVFEASDVEVSDDPASCGVKLLTTPDGTSVYRAGAVGLERFAVGAEGNLRYIDTPTGSGDGVHDAVLTADGRHLYTSARMPGNPDPTLRGFTRDVADGSLRLVGQENAGARRSLGMDGEGRWLFAGSASDVLLYALPSLTYVLYIPYDNAIYRWRDHEPYPFVVGRPTTATADVFGAGGTLSVVAGANVTDAMSGGDRFGNPVPLFGVPNDVAASANGHVYASTPDHGILVFERVGAGVEAVDAYVRLDILTASSGAISFGGTDSAGCVAVAGFEHDDVVYSVDSSKWQWRPNADWSWTDVAGTVSTGQFCPHTPSTPGHYRLVAVVQVDGVPGMHASNTLVRDDHGDSVADATPVDVPSATTGWLDPGDADTFRVDLAEPSRLTVYTEGWADTYGTLLDDAGQEIASDGDGGSDSNFHITLDVNAGVYAVRVTGRGAYTFHARRSEPPPDLVIATAEVVGSPAVGETVMLDVVVRNDGYVPAPATTLRYYRSDDLAVSSLDDEIGTVEVGALAAGASSRHSIDVVIADGLHRYGACVDSVDGEADPTNNCATAAMDILEFGLDAANSAPAAITHVDGQLYVGDTTTGKIHVYTTKGERRAGADFGRDGRSLYPIGLTHADGLLYVAEYPDAVSVFTTSGEHLPDSAFELAADNAEPTAIANADGLLYVLDAGEGKVFVYTPNGDRRADFDFDLEHVSGRGIVHADGLLWVPALYERSIHAYMLSGERQPSEDIQLEARDIEVDGIAYADGSLYVVDAAARRVFIYARP